MPLRIYQLNFNIKAVLAGGLVDSLILMNERSKVWGR